MDDFKKRLLWLVDQHADGKYTVFAKIAGIPHSTIQNYIKGRKPHSDHLLRIHVKFGVNLNWLISGKGDPYIIDIGEVTSKDGDINERPPPSNVIELQHMELVRDFQDKQRALNINRELMELEKLDAESFRRVESYIKGTVDAIRQVAERSYTYGPERRKAERRQENQKGGPDGIDRRSGYERRKASGGEK